MAGVTSTGFVAKTQQEILADLNAAVLNDIDAGLDLSPDQPIGQLLAIFAEKLAELWELGATAYTGFDPNSAEGALLVSLCALTGTIPDPATPSQVVCNMTLSSSTTVNPGALANVSGQPTNTWALVGPPDSAGNPIPGPVVSTTSGTYQGVFRSTSTGPVVANSGTLTVITAPVSGWSAVSNPTDASLGSIGNDPTITGNSTPLRQKREAELGASGACTVPAIRAAVLEVPGILTCTVYENTSLITDPVTTTPAKSFQVLIWDGVSPAASNNAIAQAIWDNKPSGILSYGTSSGTAIDTFGNSHVINFNRVNQMAIYIDLTTDTIPNSTQRATIKAAVKAYCDSHFQAGGEVIILGVRASALIPGITNDIPTCLVDTIFPPVNAFNFSFAYNFIPVADTSRIRVNGL